MATSQCLTRLLAALLLCALSVQAVSKDASAMHQPKDRSHLESSLMGPRGGRAVPRDEVRPPAEKLTVLQSGETATIDASKAAKMGPLTLEQTTRLLQASRNSGRIAPQFEEPAEEAQEQAPSLKISEKLLAMTEKLIKDDPVLLHIMSNAPVKTAEQLAEEEQQRFREFEDAVTKMKQRWMSHLDRLTTKPTEEVEEEVVPAASPAPQPPHKQQQAVEEEQIVVAPSPAPQPAQRTEQPRARVPSPVTREELMRERARQQQQQAQQQAQQKVATTPGAKSSPSDAKAQRVSVMRGGNVQQHRQQQEKKAAAGAGPAKPPATEQEDDTKRREEWEAAVFKHKQRWSAHLTRLEQEKLRASQAAASAARAARVSAFFGWVLLAALWLAVACAVLTAVAYACSADKELTSLPAKVARVTRRAWHLVQRKYLQPHGLLPSSEYDHHFASSLSGHHHHHGSSGFGAAVQPAMHALRKRVMQA